MPAVFSTRSNIIWAALFFFLSTAITWWFIEAGAALYADRQKMLLSCAIAGGKWALQLVAALLLLQLQQRWLFIRRLGVVCLAGSVMLLPFCFKPVQQLLGTKGFLLSLIISVLLMIGLYYRAVRYSNLRVRWFWAWIVCLAIAITLQLTLVFHVIQL